MLMRILPSYNDHTAAGLSALVGLFGLHKTKLSSGRHQMALVMRDILPTHVAPAGCVRILDLKGSLVGRKSSNATKVGVYLNVAILSLKLLLPDSKRNRPDCCT